jgi:hypothetical protein
VNLKEQQMLRVARNQCPEHNGETFCIKQGYPGHAGECKFLPAGQRFQAMWSEMGEWKTEMRMPEEVEHAESIG